MIETGKQLAESIFGQDVVDRDWAGYEHGIELRSGPDVIGFVGLTIRSIHMTWPGPEHEQDWQVAGIGFVCTANGYRGRGIATSLMKAAHWEAQRQALPYALLNAGYPEIYKRLGYFHPDNLPAGWYVCELPPCASWRPDLSVDLRGTW
jgi:GNAT superfamily N-acetyltransferase